MLLRVLLLLVAVAAVGQVSGHVALTFPRARTYDLDFLDNARTPGPCGMPRGECSRAVCLVPGFDLSGREAEWGVIECSFCCGSSNRQYGQTGGFDSMWDFLQNISVVWGGVCDLNCQKYLTLLSTEARENYYNVNHTDFGASPLSAEGHYYLLP